MTCKGDDVIERLAHLRKLMADSMILQQKVKQLTSTAKEGQIIHKSKNVRSPVRKVSEPTKKSTRTAQAKGKAKKPIPLRLFSENPYDFLVDIPPKPVATTTVKPVTKRLKDKPAETKSKTKAKPVTKKKLATSEPRDPPMDPMSILRTREYKRRVERIFFSKWMNLWFRLTMADTRPKIQKYLSSRATKRASSQRRAQEKPAVRRDPHLQKQAKLQTENDPRKQVEEALMKLLRTQPPSPAKERKKERSEQVKAIPPTIAEKKAPVVYQEPELFRDDTSSSSSKAEEQIPVEPDSDELVFERMNAEFDASDAQEEQIEEKKEDSVKEFLEIEKDNEVESREEDIFAEIGFSDEEELVEEEEKKIEVEDDFGNSDEAVFVEEVEPENNNFAETPKSETDAQFSGKIEIEEDYFGDLDVSDDEDVVQNAPTKKTTIEEDYFADLDSDKMETTEKEERGNDVAQCDKKLEEDIFAGISLSDEEEKKIEIEDDFGDSDEAVEEAEPEKNAFVETPKSETDAQFSGKIEIEEDYFGDLDVSDDDDVVQNAPTKKTTIEEDYFADLDSDKDMETTKKKEDHFADINLSSDVEKKPEEDIFAGISLSDDDNKLAMRFEEEEEEGVPDFGGGIFGLTAHQEPVNGGSGESDSLIEDLIKSEDMKNSSSQIEIVEDDDFPFKVDLIVNVDDLSNEWKEDRKELCSHVVAPAPVETQHIISQESSEDVVLKDSDSDFINVSDEEQEFPFAVDFVVAVDDLPSDYEEVKQTLITPVAEKPQTKSEEKYESSSDEELDVNIDDEPEEPISYNVSSKQKEETDSDIEDLLFEESEDENQGFPFKVDFVISAEELSNEWIEEKKIGVFAAPVREEPVVVPSDNDDDEDIDIDVDDFQVSDEEAAENVVSDSVDVDDFQVSDEEAAENVVSDPVDVDDFVESDEEAVENVVSDSVDVDDFQVSDEEAAENVVSDPVDVDDFVESDEEARVQPKQKEETDSDIEDLLFEESEDENQGFPFKVDFVISAEELSNEWVEEKKKIEVFAAPVREEPAVVPSDNDDDEDIDIDVDDFQESDEPVNTKSSQARNTGIDAVADSFSLEDDDIVISSGDDYVETDFQLHNDVEVPNVEMDVVMSDSEDDVFNISISDDFDDRFDD